MALIRTGGAPATAFDTLTWVDKVSSSLTLTGVKKGERIVLASQSSISHAGTKLVTGSTGLNSLTYAEGVYYSSEYMCIEILEANADDPVISSVIGLCGVYKLV